MIINLLKKKPYYFKNHQVQREQPVRFCDDKTDVD